MTPEGKIKGYVRKILDKYKGELDQYWPVPAGFGPSHLDCIVCFRGYFISIETKAPGKKPTPRQKQRIDSVKRAGGYALVVDGDSSLKELEELLYSLEKNNVTSAGES
jgi:hypothetical protein